MNSKKIQIINLETEPKKEYLNRYLSYQRAAKRIGEDIEELESTKTFPENRLTGMPSSHYKKDLSDYIVKLESLISQLIQIRYNKIKLYSEIYNCIEAMENETEKQVLVMKYIRGYKWEKIAECMNYSCRQVHNIHKNALEHLHISKH